jgi:hypothetical protein
MRVSVQTLAGPLEKIFNKPASTQQHGRQLIEDLTEKPVSRMGEKDAAA